jgi:xanthine dehydrogenase molybdopterin-binding subunit B
MQGVTAIIQATDVPGSNNIGFVPDEELFATEKVYWYLFFFSSGFS